MRSGTVRSAQPQPDPMFSRQVETSCCGFSTGTVAKSAAAAAERRSRASIRSRIWARESSLNCSRNRSRMASLQPFLIWWKRSMGETTRGISGTRPPKECTSCRVWKNFTGSLTR